jgi:hypothetical protein
MTKQQTAYTPHDADNLIDGWNAVSEYAENCVLIAFDGCHKIYLAMDETEAKWFKENYNGAECDDRTFEGTPEQMFELLKNWYTYSCSLKFIQAVWSNEADPNAGFVSLISQEAGWAEDEEDEEEEA